MTEVRGFASRSRDRTSTLRSAQVRRISWVRRVGRRANGRSGLLETPFAAGHLRCAEGRILYCLSVAFQEMRADIDPEPSGSLFTSELPFMLNE